MSGSRAARSSRWATISPDRPPRPTTPVAGRAARHFRSPYLHIGNERSYESEAQTETRAAILGGVTTIGILLRSLEDSYFDHLPAFRKAMDERSYVDRCFTRRYSPSSRSRRYPAMRANTGPVVQVLHVRHARDREVGDRRCLVGRASARSHRSADDVVCVHCETGALIDRARQELAAASRKVRWPTGKMRIRLWRRRLRSRPPSIWRNSQAHIFTWCICPVTRDWKWYAPPAAPARASPSRPPRLISGSTATIRTASWSRWCRRCVRRSIKRRCGRDFAKASINTVGTDNTSRARATKEPEAGLHGSRPGLRRSAPICRRCCTHGRLRGVPLDVLVDRSTRAPARVTASIRRRHHRGRLRRRSGCRRSRA